MLVALSQAWRPFKDRGGGSGPLGAGTNAVSIQSAHGKPSRHPRTWCAPHSPCIPASPPHTALLGAGRPCVAALQTGEAVWQVGGVPGLGPPQQAVSQAKLGVPSCAKARRAAASSTGGKAPSVASRWQCWFPREESCKTLCPLSPGSLLATNTCSGRG